MKCAFYYGERNLEQKEKISKIDKIDALREVPNKSEKFSWLLPERGWVSDTVEAIWKEYLAMLDQISKTSFTQSLHWLTLQYGKVTPECLFVLPKSGTRWVTTHLGERQKDWASLKIECWFVDFGRKVIFYLIMLVLSSWIMMPVQDKLIAESLFRVFDEDNSGSLNFSEYLQVWPSQELTRNRFDIGVSEWQLTTLIDKRQQRRFNFHVGGGRTKAQYVT